MKRRLFAVIAVVVGLGMAGFGLAPQASAVIDPEDLGTILENAPGAGARAVEGAQDAGDTFVETQSTVEAFDVLRAAFLGDLFGGDPSVVALLVEDTTVGDLGLAAALVGLSLQFSLNPYLEAADDPACLLASLDDPTAACDVFNFEDVGTMLANAPGVPEALMEGDGFGPNGSGYRSAIIELLQGNLASDDGLAIGPSFTSHAVIGSVWALIVLTQGTNYAALAEALAITGLVALLATSGSIAEQQEELAPVFETVEPVTSPLIELLEGISL